MAYIEETALGLVEILSWLTVVGDIADACDVQLVLSILVGQMDGAYVQTGINRAFLVFFTHEEARS